MHVDDAADAFIKLIKNENKKLNGQIYNVGANSENVQIKDLAYIVKSLVPKAKSNLVKILIIEVTKQTLIRLKII